MATLLFQIKQHLAPQTTSLLFLHWNQLFHTYDNFIPALPQTDRSHSNKHYKSERWHIAFGWITNFICQITSSTFLILFWKTPDGHLFWLLTRMSQQRQLSIDPENKYSFYYQSMGFFFCRSLHGRFIYFTISTGEGKVVALILSTCPIMQMFPEPYSQILDTVGTKSKTTQGKLLHFLCVCLPPRAPPLAGSNSWGLPAAAQPFSAGHWQNQYAHSREDKKGPGLSAGTDHLRWHPCVRRKGRRKRLVPGHS